MGASTAIRVVRDYQDHTCMLEDSAPLDAGQAVLFIAMAFDLALPPVNNAPTPEITVTIDNVSTEMIRYLDTAIETQEMTELTYRPYLSNDLSCP